MEGIHLIEKPLVEIRPLIGSGPLWGSISIALKKTEDIPEFIFELVLLCPVIARESSCEGSCGACVWAV
jgi:hypothetical protein